MCGTQSENKLRPTFFKGFLQVSENKAVSAHGWLSDLYGASNVKDSEIEELKVDWEYRSDKGDKK
jgi:hypothetical protein